MHMFDKKAPQPGDMVTVSYDPKNHKAEIQIEGDPRYDPKIRRANVVDDEEPRWIVPATCTECGARIDQSRASMAEHPTCPYCAKPLPCRRA
jgi:hydrogenase maturation factor HypF (carbamoyltransferase family)